MKLTTIQGFLFIDFQKGYNIYAVDTTKCMGVVKGPTYTCTKEVIG